MSIIFGHARLRMNLSKTINYASNWKGDAGSCCRIHRMCCLMKIKCYVGCANTQHNVNCVLVRVGCAWPVQLCSSRPPIQINPGSKGDGGVDGEANKLIKHPAT